MADPLFLLDSNICIYVLKGASDAVRRRVESHAPGELVTSAIVFAEVMMGMRSSDEAARAEIFFALVTVLPFDRAAAESYVTLSFKRGSYDRLIGAHALSLGLTLVTANERDFLDLPRLRVENWTIDG